MYYAYVIIIIKVVASCIASYCITFTTVHGKQLELLTP